MITALLCFTIGNAQDGTSRIKAQFALGVNSPSSNGFVTDYKGKSVNFPTVDLGLQYMFKPKFGGRLNYSFNRISNETNSPSFKVNYARVNALLVYDANDIFSFLPPRMGVFFQAGPGYSFVKPLDNYTQNKISFFNIMAGAQFHYGISDTLSIFTDVSYVNGFAKDFNPVSEGFGSFNGNVLAITFGTSISLSGCYFCDQ
ncbi:outer membrane beta-barrel protein [Seonamhaeicola marinus]|uniref:Porin family protein n=1 Tax=Seonamhaeicola marinus TaxID=1912246 RepID=A0A5D0HG99_9FLAO|nr:outer membrane beta-barrel protein [Seonamhaeicola marinus]TYA69960.1 porin family protein [Seonamhaeicola marinus]